jgi:hypothetical protein
MATGELSESALKGSIDQSKKKKLEILATAGQAGVDAFDEAEKANSSLREASKKDIMRLAGKDNEAAINELMANRDTLMSGISTAANLGRQGFTDQIEDLKTGLTDYAKVFESQAPEYAKIEQQYRAQASARRVAAAKAKREKQRKDLIKNATDIAERLNPLDSDEGYSLNIAAQNLANAAIPPVVREIGQELLSPTNQQGVQSLLAQIYMDDSNTAGELAVAAVASAIEAELQGANVRIDPMTAAQMIIDNISSAGN